MNYILIIFSIVIISGCSRIPLSVVKERYDNVGESRTLELVNKTQYTAIVIGKKKSEKCDEIETIALSKINSEKKWKIVRARNIHYCEKKEANKRKQEFLKWKYLSNEIN